MTTTTAVTCRVRDLSKTYGRTRALNGVSFDLGPGITGLLGPNGAGKSTLLSMLATVQTPTAGTLELLGRDPSGVPGRLEIRRRLGYMPQEPGFHRSFTVFEFIDYVAILKELRDRRRRHDEVRRVIDLVGLGSKMHEKIKQLSGGMRRRVALAQALLRDPELLVLDEPTAGLDPEQRMHFRDLISELGHDRTVVLSTHQTEDVAALCGEVVVIVEGRCLLRGTPFDVTRLAEGRVWVDSTRASDAVAAWRRSDGRYRNLGSPPRGASAEAPTIEDGYLLLLRGSEP